MHVATAIAAPSSASASKRAAPGTAARRSQPHVPLVTLPQGNKPENKPGIGNQILKEGANKGGLELAVQTQLSDNTDPLATVGGVITSWVHGNKSLYLVFVEVIFSQYLELLLEQLG
jgi:hypothetical protein